MTQDDARTSHESSSDEAEPTLRLSAIESTFQQALMRASGENSNPTVDLRSDSALDVDR